MAKVMEHTGATLHGREAFMRLAGRLRYQQMEGRHFVVGGGRAVEYDTAPECYTVVETHAAANRRKRDTGRSQAAEARRVAQDLPAGAVYDSYGQQIGVGDTVEFEQTPGLRRCGKVAEIGPRSIAIDTTEGNTYRREATHCRRQA